ncbi:hypothetical protein ILUMI_03115 [Ignelater luminosus]|uniref:Chitin-binding type-2 domain-containing protein n=1 Tax=Ignelater luminosus TaxID=2038154 RepID=A0A8K0DF89_IGNLU|nr:hypothetical protein ILUMI_03115 [Ignelater luminosus]
MKEPSLAEDLIQNQIYFRKNPNFGYYADPENCRWFFACLDHGKSPLSAYEFRCPFGLVFDESRLVCEWPWLVPRCGSGGAIGFEYDNHVSISGARLNTYDGLGALGVVSLGGLSGPLVQPQAKIYSSVSNIGSGLVHNQENLQRIDAVSHGAINAGIAQGSFGLSHGGINAGLGILSTGKSVNTASNLFSGGAGFGHSLNQNSAALFTAQKSADAHLHGRQGVISGVQGASYQTNVDFGQDGLDVHHGSGFLTGNLHSNDIHLSGVNLVDNGGFGLKTSNVVNHGVTLQQPIATLTSSIGGSSYHQANLQNNIGSYKGVVNAAPIGRIHIVGGFSAVGTGGKSISEFSQNNLNIDGIAHVTPLPPGSLSAVSIVSPSPVPAVAAVPVPVVKSGSETYDAGVVANVPELQYKIVTPSASNVFLQSDADFALSRGLSGLTNITHNYVNYVTTPAPIALPTTPVVSFVQSSTVRPIINLAGQAVVHEGYHYQKPVVAFDETPASVTRLNLNRQQGAGQLLITNNYVTPKPVVLQPVQPAVVSSFSVKSVQKPLEVVQPVVSVTPVVPVVHNVQPIVTPTVSVVHQRVKPATISGYSFQNTARAQTHQGSKVLVQPVVDVIPSAPAVATVASNYNIHTSNEGYVYSKPKVAFEDSPIHTVEPVQPGVVSSFSVKSVYKPLDVVQPVVSVTPVVPVVHNVQPIVTPTVSVVQQRVKPATISGYSFQNTARAQTHQGSKVLVQPVVSVIPAAATVASDYNLHTSNEGYVYSKPQVAFEDGLVHTVKPVQPAVVSSFSINTHQKPLTVVQPTVQSVQPIVSVTPIVPIAQQKVHSVAVSSFNSQNVAKQGYEYTRPAVSFVQPIISVTPSPATVSRFSFQNITHNQGYDFSKQISPVHSVVRVTPATPIIKESLYQQPAIVSSFNFENTFNNQGYQNVKQAVPILQHTFKPVQPAVVSSYSFQTDYTKQEVPVQPLVSVTPVTPIIKQNVNLVQPAVVSSYNYQNADFKYKGTKQFLQPVVSVTPTVPIIEERVQPVQPAVVSSFSIQNVDNSFKHVQPVQPIVSVTPSVPVQPVVPIIKQNIQPVQPAVVSSFNFHNTDNRGGYKYSQQPVVSVTPTVPVITQNIQPVQPAVVSSYRFQTVDKNQGYSQIRPVQPIVSVTPVVPIIKENVQPLQPAVVSSFSFHNTDNRGDYKYTQKVQPVVSVTPTVPIITEKLQPIQPAVVSSYSFHNNDNRGDYKYTQKVQPIVSVTPTVPIITENVQPVQPAVVSSYSFHNTDNREVPIITENVQPVQPAVVSSYNIHNINKNEGYVYNKQIPLQPVIHVTPTPTVPTIVKKLPSVQPAVVSSYSFSSVANNEGYKYSKATVPIQPVQTVVSHVPAVINKNIIKAPAVSNYNFESFVKNEYPKQTPLVKQPAVVSSYSFNSATEHEGYVYDKPSIAFEEKPLQPLPLVPVSTIAQVIPNKIQYTTQQQFGTPVVSNYNFESSVGSKIEDYNYVRSEVKPVQPVFSTFSIRNQQKPVLAFGQKQIVQPVVAVTTPVVPIIEQKVVPVQPIDGDFGVKINAKPALPTVVYESSTIDYSNRQPVREEPFVAKKAYVTGQNVEVGYNYLKPAIAFEEGPAVIQQYSTPIVTSTVRPFQEYVQQYQTNRKNLPRGKVTYTSTPTYVEDYYYSTPKPNIYISTPAPFTKAKSRSRVDLNAYNVYTSTPSPTYASTVAAVLTSKPQPFGQFNYYDSRLQTTAVPIVPSTLGSLNNLYQSSIATSTLRPTVISTSPKSYVDDSFEISTPSREYLPSKLVNKEYVITTKSKPKTYIRVNDFHPLLPAKLGAQCTCSSNTLTLRRKPVVVAPTAYETVSVDNGYDTDEYLVKPKTSQNVNIPVRSGVVLENYVYEPTKIVDITPSPTVLIKSTTNTILPAPAPAFTKTRVRARPSTTPSALFSSAVTQVPEVFLRKTVPTVAIYKEEESRATNEEVVDYVNQGLNLVKSAVKGAVKEALTEHAFDRYGPGGLRSRQETLQGTIDCQRAGLFRHPEQCNKFYACRWDCTKKRFTLHVFNCPVHLTFDPSMGACNWPSQGPACAGNTLLPNE